MSGQEFPDKLPSAYVEKYGPGTLRDHQGPELDEKTLAQVEARLGTQMSELRRAFHV